MANLPASFVDNHDIAHTWKFLDILFQNFLSIEARKAEVAAYPGEQQLKTKGERRMRNRISRDIGPYILLGTQYLFSIAKEMLRSQSMEEELKADWLNVFRCFSIHRYVSLSRYFLTGANQS